MTAALVVSMVVIALLIALVVSITLLFSRALSRTLSHADSIHDRNSEQLESVLDRLMAIDFAEFKLQQQVENADEGGFDEPSDEGQPEPSDAEDAPTRTFTRLYDPDTEQWTEVEEPGFLENR